MPHSRSPERAQTQGRPVSHDAAGAAASNETASWSTSLAPSCTDCTPSPRCSTPPPRAASDRFHSVLRLQNASRFLSSPRSPSRPDGGGVDRIASDQVRPTGRRRTRAPQARRSPAPPAAELALASSSLRATQADVGDHERLRRDPGGRRRSRTLAARHSPGCLHAGDGRARRVTWASMRWRPDSGSGRAGGGRRARRPGRAASKRGELLALGRAASPVSTWSRSACGGAVAGRAGRGRRARRSLQRPGRRAAGVGVAGRRRLGRGRAGAGAAAGRRRGRGDRGARR